MALVDLLFIIITGEFGEFMAAQDDDQANFRAFRNSLPDKGPLRLLHKVRRKIFPESLS